MNRYILRNSKIANLKAIDNLAYQFQFLINYPAGLGCIFLSILHLLLIAFLKYGLLFCLKNFSGKYSPGPGIIDLLSSVLNLYS